MGRSAPGCCSSPGSYGATPAWYPNRLLWPSASPNGACLQGEILVKGRPAHGSRPREGVSAVEIGAQIALALHAADFGGPDHPLLGRPTANVGTFHGGSALNVVAEQARVGFDRRLLPGISLEEAIDGLHRRIDGAGLGTADYEIKVQDYGEGSEMSADHPFAALVRRCVSRRDRPAPRPPSG